jgi:type II secretory pathway pseudopilin PulG
MKPRPAQRRSAFTLLEMIIATGLIVLVMTTLAAFYNRALDTRTESTLRSRRAQLARVVLDRMAREIQQAVAELPTFGTGIFGYRYGIDINTLVVPDRALSEVRKIRSAKLPGQFDLVQVTYYIAWDEVNVDTNGEPRALGLVRKENRTYLRDLVIEGEEAQQVAETGEEAALAVKEELYAPEIKYLEFLYFDGARWWDEWRLMGPNSLPAMIRITIGFVPELPPDEQFDLEDDETLNNPDLLEPLPPDRYTMLVRLRQSDVFSRQRLMREMSAFGEEAGM